LVPGEALIAGREKPSLLGLLNEAKVEAAERNAQYGNRQRARRAAISSEAR
jgi:hypothetical protein